MSCEQRRPYTYTGPVYAEEEFNEAICPWCIADGSAASRFDATFTDAMWAVPDDVPEDVTEEVLCRTPGFTGWLQEEWLHHCGDAAAFLGPVGASEVADLLTPWMRCAMSTAATTGPPTKSRNSS